MPAAFVEYCGEAVADSTSATAAVVNLAALNAHAV